MAPELIKFPPGATVRIREDAGYFYTKINGELGTVVSDSKRSDCHMVIFKSYKDEPVEWYNGYLELASVFVEGDYETV